MVGKKKKKKLHIKPGAPESTTLATVSTHLAIFPQMVAGSGIAHP